MKKLFFGFLLLWGVNVGFAQSVFDTFENRDDVDVIIVNKKMFSLLTKMENKDAASQQYVELLKRLDDLKVFTTKNPKRAEEMKTVSVEYSQAALLKESATGTDNGKNVKLYTKSGTGDSQINELLMFVEGSGREESVLMSIIGNFQLAELPLLADKMKLPGGEALKSVSKK